MSVPKRIKDLANKVRNEIYGKDVRESIAKSMEVTGETAEDAKIKSIEQTDRVDTLIRENPQPSEVVDARGNFDILRDRLNSSDQQLAQTTSDIGNLSIISWIEKNPNIAQAIDDLRRFQLEDAVNIKTPPYNVSGSGIDETEMIQKAFIDAYKKGKSVKVPNPASYYLISKPIFIIADSNELKSSVAVVGENLENTVFKPSQDFSAHGQTGNLAVNSMFLVANETYLNENGGFKEGTGSTHSVFIDNLYALGDSENKNVDYAIAFLGSNASSTYSRIRARYFKKAGFKNFGHFYLNMLTKCRVDGTPISYDFGTGVNTSVHLDSCYSVGATEVGFKVQGVYMTMTNPAVDGCSGNAYDLTGFNGTVISPGSESPNAKNVFRGGIGTNVTVINPYTLGNFDDVNAWHIVAKAGARFYIKGGDMLVDQGGSITDRVALGGLFTEETLATVEFENVNTGYYTKNSNYKDALSSKEYKNLLGRINTRHGGDLSYIGFDGGSGNPQTRSTKALDGLVDYKSENARILGNAMFFGFGNNIGRTDDGKDVNSHKGLVKGDVLLTRKPKEVGGAGWLAVDSSSRLADTEIVKIPIIHSGTTAERPIASRVVGQRYYDTTLGTLIYWAGAGQWKKVKDDTVA